MPLNNFPQFDLGLRLRLRKTWSKAINNGTLVWSPRQILEPQEAANCGYRIYGIFEDTERDDFSYQRSFGILSGHCLLDRVKLTLRGFWGAVKESGKVPAYGRFGPQALGGSEKPYRSAGAKRLQRIWTTSLDLEIPLRLPITTSFFLMPRKSRWRLFLRLRLSLNPDYEYESLGIGFKVPLGGDKITKRRLALTNVSVLAVLQKKINGAKKLETGFAYRFLG